MAAVFRLVACALLITAALTYSQTTSPALPESGTLSATDRPLFQAEIARIEKLLANGVDKHASTYLMARTYAYAKQWPETMEWLQKVAASKAGLDPSRDGIFADLRGTREFQAIVAAARESTPAVSRSTVAFTVGEGDLTPESVAYDPNRNSFYFGSLRKHKLIRCSKSGACSDFASGLGTVLGLKVHGGGLWLLNNSQGESALIQYELTTGAMVRKYPVAGDHLFNDLAFVPNGDLYLTDTRAGAVWHLAKNANELKRLPQTFPAANGIAISDDGGILYVSTFPDGITLLDLKVQTALPIARPDDLCLANVDGLYFHHGALIAIQNGWMTPRVVRLSLTRDLRRVERFEALERRNPLFDGMTTGVIAGSDFFYMANIQDDKTSNFDPIKVLRLHL